MITEQSLPVVVKSLADSDSTIAALHIRYGMPPLWKRDEGFPTFIHLILEQQVSLASALAAFKKLKDAIGEVTPVKFLRLSDDELKAVGFSRQKTGYGRHVAQAILNGTLNVDELRTLSDDDVRKRITSVKGLGPWTANIYLLMALGRPDVWPSSDLALQVALQEIMTLPERPTSETLDFISFRWKPFRAAAARMLWHYYLSTRKRI